MPEASVPAGHTSRRLPLRPRPQISISAAQQPPLPTSSLFRLPTELLLFVANQLSAGDRILLSQTCRQLRSLVQRPDEFEIVRISRSPDTDAFYCALARQRPGHWFCQPCMRLHCVRLEEVPVVMHNRPRGESHFSPAETAVGFQHCCNRGLDQRRKSPHNVLLEHQHVQLALEYARLLRDNCITRRHRSYPRLLIHPFSDETELLIEPKLVCGTAALCSRPAMCEYFPKLVTVQRPLNDWHANSADHAAASPDAEIRYLLLTVVHFPHHADVPPSVERLGTFQPCPHQTVNYWDTRWRKAVEINAPRPPRGMPRFDLAIAIREAISAYKVRLHNDHTERPSSRRRDEYGAVCPHCPTDYSVRISAQDLKLRIWQDIGPEGSPHDLKWRLHTSGLSPTEPQSVVNTVWSNMGLVLPRESGSIRRLYRTD